MTTPTSEMETVVKRILPYLRQRGYDDEMHLSFETPVKRPDRYTQGYADVVVRSAPPGSKAQFLIEAKRSSRKLTDEDRKQAVSYSHDLKVPFVIVTNGTDIRCYNANTADPLKWNGKLSAKIPTRAQLSDVLAALRANPKASDVSLGADDTVPYRPFLPRKQLNALFARCHNTIRNIEKSEETAFSDFSKLLFLKLLEERTDAAGNPSVPYSYRFWELASLSDSQADQVKSSVLAMIEQARASGYADVLAEDIQLRQAKTFASVIRELAAVTFSGADLDTKGEAFEYFVRSTLKGRRLGQYFTPRPLVRLMSSLAGSEAIANSIAANTEVRVLDPACGTGGFLVYLLKSALSQVSSMSLTSQAASGIEQRLKRDTFHGADANQGIASAARMNMVVAGDGHTNIKNEDSLRAAATIWSWDTAGYDFILTNPPFGTSETLSLSTQDRDKYPVDASKGQLLFLQRMVRATKVGGKICTVIDEGVLNTQTALDVRRFILQECFVRAVVRLPSETFQPNKINVKASVLLLERRAQPDPDATDNYFVTFCDLQSLGYEGSGEPIRGFQFERLISEFATRVLHGASSSGERAGHDWRAFDVAVRDIAADPSMRLDCKYWDPAIIVPLKALAGSGGQPLSRLNLVVTERGRSPAPDCYVDADDGYAVIVKAGNISSDGNLELGSADWVEEAVFHDLVGARAKSNEGRLKRDVAAKERVESLRHNDVLLASTGDGTLGKASWYDDDRAALPDGHVTVLRVDAKVVDPQYLADYLRCGFGRDQVERLYTGSTGLIELTPADVDSVVVDLLGGVSEQRSVSRALRRAEKLARGRAAQAEQDIGLARTAFHGPPETTVSA